MSSQNQSQGLLIISTECPNCKRVLETLSKIKNHGLVIVDYSVLTPMQRVGIDAVPTLVLNSGKRLVGTDVFKYINETLYSQMEIDGFAGFDNSDDLAFSSVGDSVGYCDFTHSYAEL